MEMKKVMQEIYSNVACGWAAVVCLGQNGDLVVHGKASTRAASGSGNLINTMCVGAKVRSGSDDLIFVLVRDVSGLVLQLYADCNVFNIRGELLQKFSVTHFSLGDKVFYVREIFA